MAYYRFIRVQEVYTINKRKLNVVYINILITNENPYMRPLLLKITVWEVKGAQTGKTVYVLGAWERAGNVRFTGN